MTSPSAASYPAAAAAGMPGPRLDDHARPVPGGDPGRPVSGPVVHDDDLQRTHGLPGEVAEAHVERLGVVAHRDHHRDAGHPAILG